MKIKHNKIINLLKSYLIFVALLLFCGLVLKTVETAYFIKLAENILLPVFLKSFITSIIVFCFYSALLFPVYLILFFLNKTVAKISISIFFSLLILFEISLTIYLFSTGSLLGAELFVRPFSEIISTVETTVPIWVPIVAIIFTITTFYFLSSFINRKILNKKIILPFSTGILITAFFILLIPTFTNSVTSPTIRNYIQNKSFYCFHSTRTYSFSELKNNHYVPFDEGKIREFIQEYPDRKIINEDYPLEREYVVNNVLAPYFKKDSIKPNIVIIIFESLGREWNFPNENGVSFSPFLDSLANTGLYWKNCISATRRSFGILPSMTGSLPFGVQGFQFGIMPEHNSLIKILKNNDYQTNAFYAGAFNFDAVNDYLIVQNIDYMSENYYIDFEKNKTEYNGNPYWGYHDSILYAKIIADSVIENTHSPIFNLIVTTSAHQSSNKNNPYLQRAYKLVHEIIASAPKEKQDYYLKRVDRSATIAYQDLCLKTFFENLKKRADFENTIFVLTGDHASGMMQKSDLSAFHVPLIIWSPLLLSHKTFPALVSHNDFVPTIESLLTDHYNLIPSTHSHWFGNALDTSSVFSSEIKTVMFDYSNGYKDLIYNNYYYNGQLFEIQNEDLDLTEIQNDVLKEVLQHKLNLYKYIHHYVYINNKLTSSILHDHTKFETIEEKYIKSTSVQFKTKPKWRSITLYPETNIKGNWEKIKISITGEILFETLPDNPQLYELMIKCKGKNMQNANSYTDKINKFIMVETLEVGKWYPLHVEKQFIVDDATDLKAQIYFWIGSNNPENYSKLRNIRIRIEGKKNF